MFLTLALSVECHISRGQTPTEHCQHASIMRAPLQVLLLIPQSNQTSGAHVIFLITQPQKQVSAAWSPSPWTATRTCNGPSNPPKKQSPNDPGGGGGGGVGLCVRTQTRPFHDTSIETRGKKFSLTPLAIDFWHK